MAFEADELRRVGHSFALELGNLLLRRRNHGSGQWHNDVEGRGQLH